MPPLFTTRVCDPVLVGVNLKTFSGPGVENPQELLGKVPAKSHAPPVVPVDTVVFVAHEMTVPEAQSGGAARVVNVRVVELALYPLLLPVQSWRTT